MCRASLIQLTILTGTVYNFYLFLFNGVMLLMFFCFFLEQRVKEHHDEKVSAIAENAWSMKLYTYR